MYKENEKTYMVKFKGVTKGAIGITCSYKTTVRGVNEDDARINLYDRFDHVSFPKFELIHEDKELSCLWGYK